MNVRCTALPINFIVERRRGWLPGTSRLMTSRTSPRKCPRRPTPEMRRLKVSISWNRSRRVPALESFSSSSRREPRRTDPPAPRRLAPHLPSEQPRWERGGRGAATLADAWATRGTRGVMTRRTQTTSTATERAEETSEVRPRPGARSRRLKGLAGLAGPRSTLLCPMPLDFVDQDERRRSPAARPASRWRISAESAGPQQIGRDRSPVHEDRVAERGRRPEEGSGNGDARRGQTLHDQHAGDESDGGPTR